MAPQTARPPGGVRATRQAAAVREALTGRPRTCTPSCAGAGPVSG